MRVWAVGIEDGAFDIDTFILLKSSATSGRRHRLKYDRERPSATSLSGQADGSVGGGTTGRFCKMLSLVELGADSCTDPINEDFSKAKNIGHLDSCSR